MKALVCLGSALVLAIATSAGAVTISYTVDTWGPNQYPAATIPPANAPWGVDGYPGDTLELATYTGVLDLVPGTQTLKINTLNWTIDYTYGGTATDPDAWSNIYHTITASRGISFASGPSGSLSQTAQLENQWENDFLTLDAGTTSSFVIGSYQVDVTPLGISQFGGSDFSGSNPWVQPSVDVLASFTVTLIPEPATLSLLALGSLALIRRQH
ncbi:MAG: PEP-CTERM sorting domain-containing protein [Phycisphaeraceae bacterium]|nr:PEP-CTERM sorting domain-containing protein [Phycisphaeraceae bacterium]